MGKGVVSVCLLIVVVSTLAGCAAFRRPVRSRTLETRPIAPTEQARIKAMAAEAEAAAAAMQERMTGQKAAP
jgi:hypothetical protein